MATTLDLYTRGAATLLAAWEEFARGSAGAAVRRLDGVSAAVFPCEPERAVYNNALLDRTAAVDVMEFAYASAAVDRYAAWIHETDTAMRAELIGRGYRLSETTRAMGMELDDSPPALGDAEVEVAAAAVGEHVRLVGMPDGFLGGADPSALHVLVATLGGEDVATGLAFDHEGDCGIYNVTTLEPARRRGIGTALTARLLRDAAARGCTTATLQSTEMAERVYAAVGFRDLGRILEYVPPVA